MATLASTIDTTIASIDARIATTTTTSTIDIAIIAVCNERHDFLEPKLLEAQAIMVLWTLAMRSLVVSCLHVNLQELDYYIVLLPDCSLPYCSVVLVSVHYVTSMMIPLEIPHVHIL